jgi:Protein DA1
MHRRFFIILLAACFVFSGLAALAENICAICGKEIQGTVYIVTDELTGEKKLACSDCIKLPRCYLCGLPAGKNHVELPDGRYLCERDAKTVVLDAGIAEHVCAEIKDDLDRLFSRFTSFPDNVDVSVIDRIDVQSMFDTVGNSFESPNLLGCIRPETVNNSTRYKMSLMTGLPLVELKATCAHEFSHAWVGENVPKERHARIARDAEEGFCELVAYLLMDSQGEEGQKKFILQNRYTRGQVELFIEAERRYGFDQILDWMKYGETAQLEEGHLDKVRDVQISAANAIPVPHAIHNGSNNFIPPAPLPVPAVIKLQGILWGNPPSAIINGRSFFANDSLKIKVGTADVAIRCLAIQKSSVRIQNADSGKEQELFLSPK